ncbi:MAG: penicillin-binding transpeptidase domain-containing protein, partial [Candidatus Aureabacteria bacterium]|nr:penicillin-binding transpeptidase domain-containing protein [Candidatus Auribacterota bacterium]
FSDWRPQNFSRRFAGLVTVRDALVRSLNIPALELARRLGADAVLESLRNLGLKTLDRNARDYGLGLAVGTCEVTLLDLTNAYAALARGGRYLPLRILTTETSPAPERIVSEAAAYLVSDILSGEERSLLLSGHAADALLPRFAFKTGTSNGQRDAWTVAYNPEYAVGIWFGNPRGRSSPALTGGETAAPLAGEIFRRLYPEGAGPWFEEPGNVLPQKICSRSGLPPNPCCPATGEDLAIAGVSPLYPCRVHRAAADDRSDSRVAEVWPGEIMSYLEKNGLSSRGEPTAAGAARRKLAITSPAAAQTFSLIEDLPAVPQGLSLAAAAAGAKRCFWFVDGELFAEADPSGACFWPLRPGRHAICCSDEEGNSDRVEITVE